MAAKTAQWRKAANGLDLTRIEFVCRDLAWQSFIDGQGDDFAMSGYSSGAAIDLVIDNRELLQQRDIYEEALVVAYSGCKTFHDPAQMNDFAILISVADRSKLRAAGDVGSLPTSATVYRGTCIEEARKKKNRSWSWTLSLDVACKFAIGNESPVVLAADMVDEDVYFYVTDRDEEEIVCQPKRVRRLRLTDSEIQAGVERVLEAMKRRKMAMLKSLR